MPTFDYNLGIPAGPNNPSNDQPLMQINTNSIDGLIAVDHYTFETNSLDGFHKQCTFPIQSTPVTAANQLAIYSKAGFAGTELFMYRDGIPLNATETNLTTSKIAAPVNLANGVSWLPGGLIIQWGQIITLNASPVSSGTVSFLPGFTIRPYSVTFGLAIPGASSAHNVWIDNLGTLSSTGFTFKLDIALGTGGAIFWTAIGS